MTNRRVPSVDQEQCRDTGCAYGCVTCCGYGVRPAPDIPGAVVFAHALAGAEGEGRAGWVARTQPGIGVHSPWLRVGRGRAASGPV